MSYESDNMPTELIRKHKEETIIVSKKTYEGLLEQLEAYMELTREQSDLIAEMSDTIDRLSNIHDRSADDTYYPFRVTHNPGERPEVHLPKKDVYKGSQIEIGPGKFRLNIKFGKQ